jgi:hypothetical protein
MPPDSLNVQKAVILLNPKGKTEELASSLPAYLAGKGYYVIIPDITGSGELAPKDEQGDSYISHSSYNKWYAGILTGKSIVGLRLEDISRVCTFIIDTYGIKKSNMHAVGRDIFTSDLLHAAVMTGNFSKLALVDPLISYRTMVLNKDYSPLLIQSSIAGVLQYYDLPDLVHALAPSKVLILNIKDQLGNIVDTTSENADIYRMLDGYASKSAEDNIEIRSWIDKSDQSIFESWLE